MATSIFRKVANFFGFNSSYDEETEEYIAEIKQQKEPIQKVFNFSRDKKVTSEIALSYPKSLEDSKKIADYLKGKKAVILNLPKEDPEMSKRIVDFVCGVVCAIDGECEKIEENLFLFVPPSISIIKGEHRSKEKDNKDDYIFKE